MHTVTSQLTTRQQVRTAVQALITPVWPDLPADLERVEKSEVDRLTLAFYRWSITLELADYAAGGVLITTSIAPSSPVRRTVRAIGNPACGSSTVVAREVVRDIDDVRSTLDRLGYAIRRHRGIAPFLASRWRERGIRVGT